MSKSDSISMSVIRRLPRYYRFLSELDEQNVKRISSTGLADIMNVTASQVRQDLNCFGGFGQQGYGYSVSQLRNEIRNILGLNHCYQAVLIGAGNLGTAVVKHLDFQKMGFRLIGGFEIDPDKIGGTLGDIVISSETELESFCEVNRVDAAFLCIPKQSVDGTLERLYRLGIRCFWNFSHYDISVKYPDTVVENVHLSDSLMTLCYRMTNRASENKI